MGLSIGQTGVREALISSVRNHVGTNDRVGIVGGGLGISTVVAAKKTDDVTVYEASAYRINQLLKTLRLNQLEDRVHVRHALVGPNVRVAGEMGNPDVISPGDLPTFDVLEMDCEGAELEILRNLRQRPDVIVVETHETFGAPETEVEKILDDLEYDVIQREAEKKELGIYVLTAVRK